MGLGMGFPLLLIGTSLGVYLPRVGEWMNRIKNAFALVFLGLAIQLISRILPQEIIMSLWGDYLFFSIYIAYHAFKKPAKTLKLIPILALMLTGFLAMSGIQHLLQIRSQSTNSIAHELTITTLSEAKKALHQAKLQHKAVFIDFYADWCQSCKSVDSEIQHDQALVRALQDVVVIRADISMSNRETNALSEYFGVVAPPTFIFYNDHGLESTALRLVGEVSSNVLLTAIRAIHQ
jgi:thiol:disulfide interchange protein DsbD